MHVKSLVALRQRGFFVHSHNTFLLFRRNYTNHKINNKHGYFGIECINTFSSFKSTYSLLIPSVFNNASLQRTHRLDLR